MTSFKHVKYFCFRFCHDESVKGHTIDRGLVTEVECGVCGLRQGVARGCVRCQAESGSSGVGDQQYVPITHLGIYGTIDCLMTPARL